MNYIKPSGRYRTISRTGIRIIFCNDLETKDLWTHLLSLSKTSFRTYGLTIETPEPN